MDDIKSLSHSKYHRICPEVPPPNHLQKDQSGCGKILNELGEREGVRIIAAECCLDHIRMLVEIPSQLSVASFMGYLKRKSSI